MLSVLHILQIWQLLLLYVKFYEQYKRKYNHCTTSSFMSTLKQYKINITLANKLFLEEAFNNIRKV